MDPNPLEVTVDHAGDRILLADIPLPFPLSAVGMKATYAEGRTTVVLTLEVDSLRVVPPPAPPPSAPAAPAPTPEKVFETRLSQIRRAQHGS